MIARSTSANWIRYLNIFLVLAIIASLLMRFARSPYIASDAQWALEMARNASQGHGFFSFAHQWQWGRYQYAIDTPVPIWVTRWPPGMAFVFWPTELLALRSNLTVLIVSALALLVGFLGWRKLVHEIGLRNSDLRWVVYAGILFSSLQWTIVSALAAENLVSQILPWFVVWVLRISRAERLHGRQLILFGLLLGGGMWLKYSWMAYMGAIGLTLLFALRHRPIAKVIGATLITGVAAVVPLITLFAINYYYTGHLSAQMAGASTPVQSISSLLHPINSILILFSTDSVVFRIMPFLPTALHGKVRLLLAGLVWLTVTAIFFRVRRRLSEVERVVLVCGYLGWLLTYLLLLVNTFSGHGETPGGDNLLLGSTRFYEHSLLLLWIVLITVASRLTMRWRAMVILGVFVMVVMPNLILQMDSTPPFFWDYQVGPSGLVTNLPSSSAASLHDELSSLLSDKNTIVLGQHSRLLLDYKDTERFRIWVTNVDNYDPQPICFANPGRLISVLTIASTDKLDADGIPLNVWQNSLWMGLDTHLWHPLNTGKGYIILEYDGDVPLCSAVKLYPQAN